MSPDRLRLFVAMDVPERVRAEVATACTPLRVLAPSARWVSPERWHLTLAFLGWCDPDGVAAIERALATATRATDAFPVALDGQAGMFRRQVLWAGLRPSRPLPLLAERVRAALAAASIPSDDKPFRAHLTLARARRGQRLPAGLPDSYRGPQASWQVAQVRLVRSQPQRSGSHYTIVSTWPLSGAT